MGCDVPEEQLWSWIDRDAAELEPHLAQCPRCRAMAEELRAGIQTVADGSVPVGASLPGKIGAYVITGLLGEGGQALVYKAEQQTPHRAVAVKVLKGGRCVGEQDVRHFQREIQTLATLTHPAIATIYEGGRTAEGQHFFAMELIDGVPLDVYVRERNVPLRERLELFCRVCGGVQYAHEQGVIHRDLKPSNIVVTAAGEPKILDFGLARLMNTDVTLTQTATQTGQILGTLRYMSPGQARGDPAEIDERSDVYSLGVILYELLTDRPPYELSGLMPEAVRTICETPPRRPSSINRALRGDLETIVLKALEKEPRRRYQSVADFAGDVQRHMHGEPIRARAPGRLYVVRKKLGKHRQFCTAALTVLGFALVSTWSGIRWSRHAAEQQQFRAREDLVRIQDELERGATASAKPKAEVVFAGYPQIPEAILVWAQASYRLADFKARSSAVGWLRQELQQDEGRWDCAALLAEIYREIGDPNSAIGLERQVEGQAPDTAEAWYVRSFATLEKEKALQCARNAANRAPRWVLPWQRLARLCLLTENLDDALPSAATVLAIGGDFFEWTRFRGAVFAKQRRWADAIAEYDKLVHGGERRAMAFLERGHVYRRWGRCLEAVADYTTALDLKVNAREFAIWERYHRATALWILGRRKDAADDCRAMRVDLGRPFYCDARLYLILRDEDQSARAEDVLRRALSEVDDGEPWLRKVFACLGNRLAPDDLIQDALDRENRQQLCEAYYYAGEVYRLAGQLDRARECFAGCVATGVEYDLEKFPDPMNEYDLAHWRLDQLGNKGDPSRVPDSEPVLRGTGDPPVTRTGKMPVPPM